MHRDGNFRSGSVAIIGAPNVGKSTLLNSLLGRKTAIVSDKPQTTRNKILGVLHRPQAEIVLVDTPGIHHPRFQLNRRIVRVAKHTLDEVDCVLFMIEARTHAGRQDCSIIDLLKERPLPVILLINKVDLVKKTRLLPLIDECRPLFSWTDVIPISAINGENVDRVLDAVADVLPHGQAQHSQSGPIDQSPQFLAAELIREKLLAKTYEELPYSIAVTVEDFIEEDGLITIQAVILVERQNQKAIVIGRKGSMLKAVGSEARQDMEQLFGKKVFLSLLVKVEEAWRSDDNRLLELGY
ncbi:MAG TPA: GTPase Era [Nitrospirales bacterium]|nr:GTPase Era [Nitrospirales bacterium]HIN33343.1 GTPase Era [Nitrospirales bacterium]